MNSSKSEYDLERVRLEENIKELNYEMNDIRRRISELSEQLRFCRIRKYDLEYKLKKLGRS